MNNQNLYLAVKHTAFCHAYGKGNTFTHRKGRKISLTFERNLFFPTFQMESLRAAILQVLPKFTPEQVSGVCAIMAWKNQSI